MKVINYYSRLGQAIEELRLKKNMTKTQLAKDICSISYITRIEKGERCPTSVILREITNKLGVSPDYLFRVMESSSAIDVKELVKQLFFYVERGNYKAVYDLANKREKELDILSIHDIQIIKGLKIMCKTILTQNYIKGIHELKNILKLTYSVENNPTDFEFALMFEIGHMLLLNNQIQDAYYHLKDIEKYVDNIRFLHTYAIIAHYYLYLTIACIDNSLFDDSLSNLDTGINYCKKYNNYSVLPRLYFLKAEIYLRLSKKQEFNTWYDNAFKLHELTKYSDDENFNTFAEDRISKLKTS